MKKIETIKEEKYFLGLNDIEAMQKNSAFVYFKDSLTGTGMVVTNTKKEAIAKIFSPQLAYLLTQSNIQCTLRSSEQIEYFDGSKFLGYYTDAYSKGEQDFEKDFGVNKDTLYGANAKQYVSDIHYNYFHAEIKGKVTSGEGWNNWRINYPMIITKEVIAEYGYYSGFIGKVWALATKHPQLFKDLEKCELREHAKKEKQEQANAPKVKRVSWQIDAVHFDEPKRTELFTNLIEETKDEQIRQNLQTIIKRIDNADIQIDGFLDTEIQSFQKSFAKDFYQILHGEDWREFVKDRIIELRNFCKRLEIDFKTKEYDLLEDREREQQVFIDTERYKTYLENVIKRKDEQEQADTSEPRGETNLFCKSMPLSIAREHFKVFTETKSKNKEPFLTVEQLKLFIDRAFCGKNNLPKQKFNQAPKGEKLLIQTVFYEFYNQYCFEYFNTMQCQEDFIKLLTENFEGWDFKNVQENFTPKTKKRL